MARTNQENDGMLAGLQQKPQIFVPTHYLDVLQEEINVIKEKIVSGEQPVFDCVDALFQTLEK